MGFFNMQPIPPDTPPAEIERYIENILEQLDKAFNEIREISYYYNKPIIAGTELPFAVADMEERIFYTMGTKGFALYKTPDETVKVMSHLVNYGRYLARDV
jgi:acyl-CoA synthetase (NDP forming)